VRATHRLLSLAALSGAAFVAACGETIFFNEGPGSAPPRASGMTPPGDLGVCKRPGTVRPLIVPEKLWEDTHYCSSRTPVAYIRLGVDPPDAPERPDDAPASAPRGQSVVASVEAARERAAAR